MKRSPISVVIPTIPPRRHLLDRAIESVHEQTLKPSGVVVQTDRDKLGAAWTRELGLREVRTEWVAFLDDDDFFYLNHLEALYAHAVANQADYVFSWFDTCGGDPFPTNEFRPWNNENPHQTTVTTLVRTSLAKKVGFVNVDGGVTPDGNRSGEDWGFTKGCIERGAKIVPLHLRTWHWCHHACAPGTWNTSGRPDQW